MKKYQRKRKEKMLQRLAGHCQESNINIMGVSKGKKWERAENTLKEVIAENTPNLVKMITLHTHP